MEYQKRNVLLSADDRKWLLGFLLKGASSKTSLKRAQILLALDESGGKKTTAKEIADNAGVTVQTVKNMKVLLSHAGNDIESVVLRKKREKPPREIKVNEQVTSRLLYLYDHVDPPNGGTWTVRALASALIANHDISSITPMTVHRTLKKEGRI